MSVLTALTEDLKLKVELAKWKYSVDGPPHKVDDTANGEMRSGKIQELTVFVPLKPGGADSKWRDILGDFFRRQGGSVEWPAADSLFQPIGRLVNAPQESYSPARRIFGDDVLSLSPFHCLPAHQPLGSINRVRRLAYPASSRFRHEQNVQPRREPQDISELPD